MNRIFNTLLRKNRIAGSAFVIILWALLYSMHPVHTYIAHDVDSLLLTAFTAILGLLLTAYGVFFSMLQKKGENDADKNIKNILRDFIRLLVMAISIILISFYLIFAIPMGVYFISEYMILIQLVFFVVFFVYFASVVVYMHHVIIDEKA